MVPPFSNLIFYYEVITIFHPQNYHIFTTVWKHGPNLLSDIKNTQLYKQIGRRNTRHNDTCGSTKIELCPQRNLKLTWST